jgi:NAD(P)H-dependent FMN reductase
MPISTPKLKVLVFAASLRAESLNRRLAALAGRASEQCGAAVDFRLHAR